MRSRRWGGALLIAAAAGYLLLEAVAAAGAGSAYSYATNYISDLGLSVSPRATWLHAAFYLQGILFLGGAVLVAGARRGRTARAFLGLVAANAAGNVVIALVHRGPWHVVGAAAAIVGGNLAILAGCGAVIGGGRRYRVVSAALAVLGLSSLLILLVGASPVGVWERGSVYSITLWQLLTGACLLTGLGQAAGSSTGYR